MARALLFATTNRGKLAEFRDLVGDAFRVLSPDDFPGVEQVEEHGATFEANALIKAEAWAKATGELSLADDSGLCVDALDGRPGIHSARYAETEGARIEKLLGELAGVPEARRTARFECALALVEPSGAVELARGTCEGRIGYARQGSHGFGYDPVFMLSNGRSMAELTRDEKAQVSHRGRAFAVLLERLLVHR